MIKVTFAIVFVILVISISQLCFGETPVPTGPEFGASPPEYEDILNTVTFTTPSSFLPLQQLPEDIRRTLPPISPRQLQAINDAIKDRLNKLKRKSVIVANEGSNSIEILKISPKLDSLPNLKRELEFYDDEEDEYDYDENNDFDGPRHDEQMMNPRSKPTSLVEFLMKPLFRRFNPPVPPSLKQRSVNNRRRNNNYGRKKGTRRRENETFLNNDDDFDLVNVLESDSSIGYRRKRKRRRGRNKRRRNRIRPIAYHDDDDYDDSSMPLKVIYSDKENRYNEEMHDNNNSVQQLNQGLLSIKERREEEKEEEEIDDKRYNKNNNNINPRVRWRSRNFRRLDPSFLPNSIYDKLPPSNNNLIRRGQRMRALPSRRWVAPFPQNRPMMRVLRPPLPPNRYPIPSYYKYVTLDKDDTDYGTSAASDIFPTTKENIRVPAAIQPSYLDNSNGRYLPKPYLTPPAPYPTFPIIIEQQLGNTSDISDTNQNIIGSSSNLQQQTLIVRSPSGMEMKNNIIHPPTPFLVRAVRPNTKFSPVFIQNPSERGLNQNYPNWQRIEEENLDKVPQVVYGKWNPLLDRVEPDYNFLSPPPSNIRRL